MTAHAQSKCASGQARGLRNICSPTKIAVFLFLLACAALRGELAVHSHYIRGVYVVGAGKFYYIPPGVTTIVPVAENYTVVETDGTTSLGTRTWTAGDNEVHIWGPPGIGAITSWNGAGVAYWFKEGLWWGVVWGVFGILLRAISGVGRTSPEL